MTIFLTCTNCGGEREDNLWRVDIEPPMLAVFILCPKCKKRMTLAQSQISTLPTIHGSNTATGVGSLATCRWCLRVFVRAKDNQEDCCTKCHNAYWNDQKRTKPPEGQP